MATNSGWQLVPVDAPPPQPAPDRMKVRYSKEDNLVRLTYKGNVSVMDLKDFMARGVHVMRHLEELGWW